MKKWTLILIGLLLHGMVIAPMSGQAEGDPLGFYSTRQIDQSFTLPKGAFQFRVIGSATYGSINTPYGELHIPSPGILVGYGLFEGVTTTYLIGEALGLRFQGADADHYTWGGMTQLGISLEQGFRVSHSIGLFYRQKFNERWGIEARPFFTYSMYDDPYTKLLWVGGLHLEPIEQLTDEIALRLLSSVILLPPYTYMSIPRGLSLRTDDTFAIGIPLGVALEWSWHRNWELGLSYVFSKFGFPQKYQEHLLLLTLTHVQG